MTDTIPDNILENWLVLLIDDEPSVITICRHMLKRHGAEVIAAPNAQEGLILARDHQPVFIISDIAMPGMSGYDFLRALQQDTAIRHIPVIAFTAHALLGERERALEAGFLYYLTKPLQPQLFIRNLFKALSLTPSTASRLQGLQL